MRERERRRRPTAIMRRFLRPLTHSEVMNRSALAPRTLGSVALVVGLWTGGVTALPAQGSQTLGVSGTEFRLNGEHFPYTGVSFFNAIYNPSFNRSQADRLQWLEK